MMEFNSRTSLAALVLTVLTAAQLTAESPHWAYVKPVRPAVPQVSDARAVNAIDGFVIAEIAEQGLSFSDQAENVRLLRRVSLALTGLPPSIAEVDQFMHDTSPDAYERAVDRLLASPRYGEHWARQWLDLARYADSNGYQADQLRDSWAYRDWVIRALNVDMPFDQFVIEQLAGDLLENPSIEQRIATGFHRTPTCNVEAGVDPEANRVNQVFDRVNTTATVFLGTTLECSQCHDHKYDPFPQRDYYRLFAFFNNTPLEVELQSGVQFDFVGPKMTLPSTSLTNWRRHLRHAQWTIVDAIHNAVADTAKKDLPAYKWLQGIRQQTLARYNQLQPRTTLVMIQSDPPRATRMFNRGNYLQPGDEVSAGTPDVLHGFDDTWPANRMGLSKWLVSRDNPLLARVTVNRWWAELFGRGIVDTPEDFGSQGSPPTHPQLLDWLAVEFMESGWSIKHMHKLIVMSATFRQSARRSLQQADRDPDNRWLSRGPRFRLPAETIRDNALAISGLLSTKMYGPPVMPYQPGGVWNTVGRNQPKWKVATDEDRFRRGVYVVWRRAAPYPSFVNFDAPDRASCTVQRSRTNTPLQALTLLNDPAYAEMAMALAQRILCERPEATTAERAAFGFRLCASRTPTTEQLRVLSSLYHQELDRMKHAPMEVQSRLKNLLPQLRRDDVDRTELAAWFAVANALLSMDETLNL